MAEYGIKVGGSSVSSARNIDIVADLIVKQYLSNPADNINVVVSAIGKDPAGTRTEKVTDMLLDLAKLILEKKSPKKNALAVEKKLTETSGVHTDIIHHLHIDYRTAHYPLSNLGLAVADAMSKIKRKENINPYQIKDALAAMGELSSTPIVAAVVQHKLEKKWESLETKLAKEKMLRPEEQAVLNRLRAANGEYVHVVDSRHAGFITDSNFTKATLLDSSLDTEIARHHASLRAQYPHSILMYSGFVGRDIEGNTTTIGRDGSNTTKTALAAAANEQAITIYSDTDGVLLVNPKIVPNSQTARSLDYIETVLLAKFGGMKVLEEAGLYPLIRAKKYIPITVKNTFNPDDPGTLITHEAPPSVPTMKGLGILHDMHYREFAVQDPRAFQQLERTLASYKGVNILKSTLDSNGAKKIGKFVFAVDRKLEKRHGAEYFASALTDRIIKNVFGGQAPKSFHHSAGSLVTIVGRELGNSHKDMSRVYDILSKANGGGTDTNTHKLPVWTTPDSIHLYMDQGTTNNVVNMLYNKLKKINVVLYGLGNIGPAFLQKAIENYDELGITVTGIVDSSGGYAKIGGFTTHDLEAIIAAKKGKTSLKEAAESSLVEGGIYLAPEAAKNFRNLRDFCKGDTVLVDATSESSMIHRLAYALHLGAKVISVNKAPYAVEKDNGHAKRQIPQLFEALLENRLFNRGTVGADIGVPGKLLDILIKNPAYVTVRGCSSGTLGYTTTLIEEGKPLSDGVQGAIAEGFTEPNPYKDFSGNDVLNKMVVLWRTIATKYGLDPFDIKVSHESYLAPAIRKYEELTGKPFETSDLSGLTKTAFVERMKMLDGPFKALQKGLPEGYVLRYVGEISYDEATKKYSISVGMREVHKTNSLGSLKGPDNRILFGINSSPDDLQDFASGKGAGIVETANAIMRDLKEIVSMARGEYGGRKIGYVKRPLSERPTHLPMVNWHRPSQKATALMGYSQFLK
ncbi:TPA: hypothetical protein HA280_05290 [Candidatus Woesearchaeota archaeon]|nr:hypothetical protein [Candidatus Woesearchaeota archaeon]